MSDNSGIGPAPFTDLAVAWLLVIVICLAAIAVMGATS